jgi:hypothetical protein
MVITDVKSFITFGQVLVSIRLIVANVIIITIENYKRNTASRLVIGRGQKINGEFVKVVYYNKFITKDTKAKHTNITTICKDNLN